MRGMIHVAARELIERKLIFAGCLMVGILSFAAPLIPGMRQFRDERGAITFFAAGFAVSVGIGLAFLTGATIIGRDLAERRLSFYFARPLSHGSIWGGKMLGAFLITFLGPLIVLLPATIIGKGLFVIHDSTMDKAINPLAWKGDLIVWTVLLFFIGLAHVASIALRARSRWVALDVFGLLAVGFIVWWGARPLLVAGAFKLIRGMGIAFGIILMLAVFVAGAIGIARGRTDIRVAHRATSIALISILAAAATAVLLFSFWVRSAGLDDLQRGYVTGLAEAGEWIAVQGEARGRADYTPAFLVHPASGNSVRIPSQSFYAVGFSADGKKAAWGELVNLNPVQVELFISDLNDADHPIVKPLRVTLKPQSGFGPALSADGSRMALVDNETLSIYDTSTGKSLGSVAVRKEGAAWAYSSLRFFGNDLVRLHRLLPDATSPARRVTLIHEFDLSSRKLTEVARFAGYRGAPNSTRDRMLVFTPWTTGHALTDRAGATISDLSFEGEETQLATWLSDDRIAVVTRGEKNAHHLRILDSTGAEQVAIDLGAATRVGLGGEAAAGKLVATLDSGNNPRLVLIDLEKGTIRNVADGLRPAVWEQARSSAPGGIGSRVYRTKGDGLIYLDPLTGERKTIVGKIGGATS